MIHLYAEHLLNIHTLSIQASLPTPSTKETRATISADGSLLTINHDGEVASIRLPISLSPRRESKAVLTLPAVPSKEISFRVQLEQSDVEFDSDSPLNGTTDGGNIVPWTAYSLTPTTNLKCWSCGAPVIQRGTIQTWKDLPSEEWAEMMEFWHCHKPREPHQDHAHGDTHKSYGPSSKIALEGGVGLVHPTYFLFMPDDCSNIESHEQHKGTTNQGPSLRCTTCHHLLGFHDTANGAYRIRKMDLSANSSTEEAPTRFDRQKWLACRLLCAMEDKGVRQFVVSNAMAGEKLLKLWIFAPELMVSSSFQNIPYPVRVVKVLWQELDKADHEGPQRLTTAALAVDELTVDPEEASLMQVVLENSAPLLSSGARKFQAWNVGLLERFTATDITAI